MVKQKSARIAGMECSLSYLIQDGNECLAFVFTTTSEAKALAISQSLGGSDGQIHVGWDSSRTRGKQYHRFTTKKSGGYQTWYKGICVSDEVGDSVIFTDQNRWQQDAFERIQAKTKLPLLKEWAPYLTEELLGIRQIEINTTRYGRRLLLGSATETDKCLNTDIPLGELVIMHLRVREKSLSEIISRGLKNEKIRLADHAMEPLGVTSLDDYILRFNASIGEKLEEETLFPKSGNLRTRSVNGLALKTKKLFPQQADSAHGIISAMQAGDKYVLMSCDMGTGKTIMALSAVEGFFNQKWLKKNPGKSLKDCFTAKEVNYRAAVICPSHLTEKWKREAEQEIPGIKAHIITTLSQLVYLKNHRERNGKELFIFSQETAKNDTLKRPVPTKIRARRPIVNICADCLQKGAREGNARHREVLESTRILERSELNGLTVVPVKMEGGKPSCVKCGGSRTRQLYVDVWHAKSVTDQSQTNKWEGMVCPECGELLLAYSSAHCSLATDAEKFGSYVLGPHSFGNKTATNECCQNCGAALWEDSVEALKITKSGSTGIGSKSAWRKIKFFSNHAKEKAGKLDKSAFALTGYEFDTIDAYGVGTKWEEQTRKFGPRRYSLARYAKKYLKGCFDVLIADECHLYEGLRTERAIAFHHLSKCADFTLGLTGTLTNGTASSLFAIHWSLNPGLMKELGFTYDSKSLNLFNQTYGVIETKFEYDSFSASYNAQGKGRQIGQPRVKPGINPMVYPDMLLDHAVMLNIGDMSNKLPPLNEFVETVEMDDDVRAGYKSLMNEIKDALNSPPKGAGMLGTLINMGLSYPDKPWGRSTLWSLKVKDCKVAEPADLAHYGAGDLLNKEKRLCEIVSRELSENRKVFVFTEYSGKEESDVDGRIKTVLEKECGLTGEMVKVIKSGDVLAADREEHIRKNAASTKVFITNYRNVETGIDFIGEYEGRKFNYPTIVFFQTGTSLSSVWQASRRHYRLNQTQECRTYYLVYKGTYQEDILEMMARKISAASAIQGNFSASALENMAGGVEDPTVALAKKLMAGDMGGNTTTDVEKALADQRALAIECSQEEEDLYVGSEPVTFYDVMGSDYTEVVDFEEEVQPSLFASDGTVDTETETKEEKSEKETVVEVVDFEDEIGLMIDVSSLTLQTVDESVVKASTKKNAVCLGQLSLF